MSDENIKIQKIDDEIFITKNQFSFLILIAVILTIIVFILFLIKYSAENFIYLVIIAFSALGIKLFHKVNIKFTADEVFIHKSYFGIKYYNKAEKCIFSNLVFIVKEYIDSDNVKEYEFYVVDYGKKINIFTFHNADTIDLLFENIKNITGKHIKFIKTKNPKAFLLRGIYLTLKKRFKI